MSRHIAVSLDHEYPRRPPSYRRRPFSLRLRGGFARSLATLNACSYVLGIGDRHLDNFLLDTTTGSVHVAFWGVRHVVVTPCCAWYGYATSVTGRSQGSI